MRRNSATPQAKQPSLQHYSSFARTALSSFDRTTTVNFAGGTITINDTFTPSALGTIAATVTFNQMMDYTNAITITNTGSASFAANQSFSDLTTTGTLTGSGNVTVNGVLTWTGGTMSGSGRTVVAGSGSLNLSGSGNKVLSRVLQNDGTASWSGSGALVMSGGTFENNGSFTGNGGSTLLSVSGGTGGVFTNAGTVVKLGSGEMRFVSSVPFRNTGSLGVQQGTLSIDAGGSNFGSIVVTNGATVDWGNSYTHVSGSTISGGGLARFGNGTHVVPAGTFSPTGQVNFAGGTITINDTFTPSALGTIAATVTFNQMMDYTNAITITGSASFAANQSFSDLTLSGILTGAGDITVNGILSWTDGNMQGGGKTIIASGATLNMSGGPHRLSRVLQNDGTANWTANQLRLQSGRFENNGSFTASSSALLHCLSDGGSGNTFTNAGVFTKLGTGEVLFGNAFNNTGSVDVQAGMLTFNSGFTQSDGITSLSGGISEDLPPSNSKAARWAALAPSQPTW